MVCKNLSFFQTGITPAPQITTGIQIVYGFNKVYFFLPCVSVSLRLRIYLKFLKYSHKFTSSLSLQDRFSVIY